MDSHQRQRKTYEKVVHHAVYTAATALLLRSTAVAIRKRLVRPTVAVVGFLWFTFDVNCAVTMRVPTTFESVPLAELNVGLPPMSFHKLIGEPDDWSFILKLHAIIESALTRLLEKRLTNQDFDDPMSFTRKLQLLQSVLPVPDEEYRSFLGALNYLRNRFAHEAKYIAADLQTVFQEIPSRRRQALLECLGVCYFPHGQNPDQVQVSVLRAHMTAQFPRPVILMSAGYALEMLSLAYYVELGNDGNCYSENFRPQLQDLLNDPAVIEFQRGFTNWLRENGYSEEEET